MSFTKTTRGITLTIILATYLSSSIASAQEQRSGQRRGPPPEAFEVCSGQSEGAACSFSGRRGEVSGSCIIPPHDEEALVCAPEGGPPRDHEENEFQG